MFLDQSKVRHFFTASPRGWPDLIEDACGDHTAAPLSLHFGVDPCGKQASKASQARTSHQIKARKSEQAKQASKKAGRKEGRNAEGTMSQPEEYSLPARFGESGHRNFVELLHTTAGELQRVLASRK